MINELDEQQKEHNQELIDDFVLRNDALIEGVAIANTKLYDASIQLLSLLSTKFGTGQQIEKLTEAEIEAKKPKVEMSQPTQTQPTQTGGGTTWEVGDKFRTKTGIEITITKKRPSTTVFDKKDTKGVTKTDYTSNTTIKDNIEKGTWVKIGGATQTQPTTPTTTTGIKSFAVGDLFQVNPKTLGDKVMYMYEVVSFIPFKDTINLRSLETDKPVDMSLQSATEYLNDGSYVLMPFKNGTEFEMLVTRGKYTIVKFKNQIVYYVRVIGSTKGGFKYSSDLVSFLQAFKNGNYVVLQPTTTTATTTLPFKVGDSLITSNGEIWEINFIDTLGKEAELERANGNTFKQSTDVIADAIAKGSYTLMESEFGMQPTTPEVEVGQIYRSINTKIYIEILKVEPNSVHWQEVQWSTSLKSFVCILKANITPKSDIDYSIQNGSWVLVDVSTFLNTSKTQIEVGQIYSSRNTGDYVTIQNIDNSKGEVTWQTVTWNIPIQIFVTIGTPQSNTIAELEDYIDSGIWERVALSKMPKPKATTKATTGTRPSPSQHASGQSVGTRARGNDGNMWVVKAASNGVKRWVKE